MITSKQREELKKYLGRHYATGVLKILKEQGVKKLNGDDYTAGSVRNVFAGQHENRAIEGAIYDYANEKKIETKNLEQKKGQFFRNEKRVDQ
ncbi:hypothetical protein [Aquimarina aggregata]|uniref:hypothetical protein n=1 Tax=Aquimarina aggregata TaxID=1642818 RepID=UPI002491389D|nr:hypothetical protein [Aquimarina aggregata]